MKKEILEQAVLDYISEKFKDKVVDKRVQTFFTYSELVDTVLSFTELLNKNIEQLEKENAGLKAQIEKMKNCQNCKFEDLDCLTEPCSVCGRLIGEDIKREGTFDKWEIKENE